MDATVDAAAPPSARATVKRNRQRGRYDAETVHAILDEALVCHLGAVVDGSPVVLPNLHVRVGETVYLHGASANALLNGGDGAEVCLTATLVDGLVLARSAFHHSVNYRSVVVHGRARRVDDPAEKRAALDALVDHVVPGRAAASRAPSDTELRSTMLLALPIDEASAKLRTGPPIDDEDDLGLPHWAGVLPLSTVAGTPLPDPALPVGTPVPDHVVAYRRAASESRL